MPINPIRFNPVDAPPPPRPMPAVDFSGITSLGDSIGRARLTAAIGALTVTDAAGNVDYDQTSANLARAGLLGPDALQTAGYRKQQLAETAANRAAQEAHHRAMEATARAVAERPDYHYQAPDLLNPGVIIEAPRRPGAAPIRHPWPNAPATVGPQSEADIPAAARHAAAGPAMGEQLPPAFYPRQTPGGTPSEGPPYQVAQAAPAPATAPATTAGRNVDYLRSLPSDAARTLVRAVAEYEVDPASLDAKLRAQALVAAKTYRPDFNAAEYQKRGSPPSGEIAARMGLAKGFLDRVSDIRPRIEGGEMSSLEGRGLAALGQGGPGELRRAIDEGADAILRGLTGAGMGVAEAGNYVRRYQFSPFDTRETQVRKLNELEAALRYVNTEIGKGRGGEDLLKGFTSQFGKPVAGSPSAAPAIPAGAIGHLRSNPGTRDQFDAKYGAGAADRVLGGR